MRQILGFVRQKTWVMGNTWSKHVGFLNLSLLLTSVLLPYNVFPCLSPIFMFLFSSCILAFCVSIFPPSFCLSSVLSVAHSSSSHHTVWPSSSESSVPLLHPVSPPMCDISQVWVCLIIPPHSNFFVANKVPSRRPSWSDPYVTSPWQQADKSTSPMTGNRQQYLSITDVSIRECESTQWRFVPV